MNWTLYAAFLPAAALINVVPGPGMFFLLAQGMSGGRRAGMVAAGGAASAMAVHTTAVAVGLATLFAAVPAAMTAVRIAGAGYLLVLAVRALRAGEPIADSARDQPRLRRVYLRAALNNLLNPKIIVFYLALLPQFVDPAAGSVSRQLLMLGCTLLVVGLAVDLIIGYGAGRVGAWLTRRARANRLNQLLATVYTGLAVRLLTS